MAPTVHYWDLAKTHAKWSIKFLICIIKFMYFLFFYLYIYCLFIFLFIIYFLYLFIYLFLFFWKSGFILTSNISDHTLSPFLSVLIMPWQTGWTHLGTPVKVCTDLNKSYGFMNDIRFLGELFKSSLVEIANSPYICYAVNRRNEMHVLKIMNEQIDIWNLK